jgi:hypothetical protein
MCIFIRLIYIITIDSELNKSYESIYILLDNVISVVKVISDVIVEISLIL